MNKQEYSIYGLIGASLVHSFSQKYFKQKFAQNLNWSNYDYQILEVKELSKLREKISDLDWAGFNVTIPHKEAILPLLDEISVEAQAIGAVNTVKIISENRWVGYNTDAKGFLKALGGIAPSSRALILGTGGASKAVQYALDTIGVESTKVSREEGKADLTYEVLDEMIIRQHSLIVQCTPLGTYPDTNSLPNIPYEALTEHHYCFDLVYNPPLTAFMNRCSSQGAKVTNGYEMLIHQAEAAWAIWQSKQG